MTACTCPYCQPQTNTPAHDPEAAPEPVELPSQPRRFRIHCPGLFPQDCTLHPDGRVTSVMGGQVWRAAFTFDEMRAMDPTGARIEWDPDAEITEPTPPGPAQAQLEF